eukprot:TRINITY_DN6249_c0_g1_i1.p1 TRINITY_DN6249_c0_g1~~TRINITY_DN6249_c0_g1_i1.p1  ORF type:complete len:310 (-),score=58.23 TRINITY_DN6249_c0_g1_i1:145-1074(-)
MFSLLELEGPLFQVPIIPLNHLTIEKAIGKGSEGKVYFAFLGKSPVAIKHIGPKTGYYANVNQETYQTMINGVLEVMMTLIYPGVPKFIGISELSDGSLYIVMDFLEGRTLQYALCRLGRFSEHQVICIATRIFSILCRIHGSNVVHGDLKTDNILVDSNYNIQICDFGLACFAGKPYRVRSKLSSAPEIAASVIADYKSDIFSVGLIMGELLVGYAFSELERFDDNKIRYLCGDVDGDSELVSLIITCLQINPKDRPTADDALCLLKELMEQHVINALDDIVLDDGMIDDLEYPDQKDVDDPFYTPYY